jgi:hypothetical protein
MTTITWPWLPVEIIESIISRSWLLPLSAKDRDTFITSSTLVNKTWATAFMKISLKDVHIPNPRYAEQYLRILRNESPVYAEHPQILPDLLCTSLSFTLDTHASAVGQHPMFIKPFGEEDKLGTMLSNTLYTLDSLSYLPNLRRISIEYANWGFNDLFDNFRLSPFPAQVTELEIKFTASSGIKSVPKQYHGHVGRVPWSLPSITDLSIVGACEEFIVDMTAACPNLATLEIESMPHLTILASLPRSVHTVVLRISSNASHWERINALVEAVVAGLLSPSPSQKPRIIVEWGEIERFTWMCFEVLQRFTGFW